LAFIRAQWECQIMTDGIYDPSDDGIDRDDATDLDQEFGSDDVDAVIDTSYSPPDRQPQNTRFGTTLAEEQQGESFDQRYAQELPDPNLASDLTLEDSDQDGDEVDQVDEDTLDEDDIAYGEVGSDRAGRLVAPDEGAHEDREKDLIGEDVGIDGGGASAEEAAVHVIPD
jgi:Family of unknown function (DUF5709)